MSVSVQILVNNDFLIHDTGFILSFDYDAIKDSLVSHVLCLVLMQAYSISKELYYTHVRQCHVFNIIYYYSTVLGHRSFVCQSPIKS